MNLSSEQFPEPEDQTSRRTRRHRRTFSFVNNGNGADPTEELARRLSPSFDFYLFSLLAGAIIGSAFLLNSQALLILAALLAPVMAPIIGASLAVAVGESRFFFTSIAGTLIGCALASTGGIIAGLLHFFRPSNTVHIVSFTVITWDNLLVLIVGVILTSVAVMKKAQKPQLFSAAIAYVVLSTAGGIGFELGSGNFQAAANNALVFAFYLLTAILIGTIIFLLYRLHPASITDYWMAFVMVVLLVMVPVIKPISLAEFLGRGATGTQSTSRVIQPKQTVVTPSTTVMIPSATPRPTGTPTPLPTATITSTPTITLTATLPGGQNAVWVKVDARGQTGGRIREKPSFGSKLIMIIDNGVMVQLLPGVEFNNDVYWAHVETIDGTIGWMVHTVLSTSTPTLTTTPTPK